MTEGITVKRRFQVRKERRGKKVVAGGHTMALTGARIPRISRLMALAIRFDQLLRDGVVNDQSELARLGKVSRARLTQLMNLLDLAPDLQLELLTLCPPRCGRKLITERRVRAIVTIPHWQEQRKKWITL